MDPITVVGGGSVLLAISLGSLFMYYATREVGESYCAWKLRRVREKERKRMMINRGSRGTSSPNPLSTNGATIQFISDSVAQPTKEKESWRLYSSLGC